MDSKKYDIFISYRREGGSHYARILKAELEKRGYRDRVFLDYDELKDGRFDSRIMDAIDNAPVFIFILSPGSLDRCVNEDDWVRQEIVYAMEHDRQIIPVNFDGLFLGFPSSIPSEVREALGQHQFTKIDSESLLNVSIDKLINERIAPIVSSNDFKSQSYIGAEIAIIADVDCQIFRFGKLLTTAKADEKSVIRLCKGNHQLEFVSVQCPEIKEEIKYFVPDNNYSDYIKIRLKEELMTEQTSLFPYRKINKWWSFGSTYSWGFADKTGKIAIPCSFDEALYFREGLAQVKKKGKWGFIDKTGNIIIPCTYDIAYNFYNGLAAVEQNGRWGFIDKSGNMVIPCIYERVGVFKDGLAVVIRNRRCGFIDKSGNMVIPCIYEYNIAMFMCSSYFFNDGLAGVIYHGKCGFIDSSGRRIIQCIYDDITKFSEGLAGVKKDGKWGFIDKSGRQVVNCIYNDVHSFNEGVAGVKKDGKWGIIDKSGRQVVNCMYEYIGFFSEGLAKVKRGGKYGFIDRTGKITAPIFLDEVRDFKCGLAKAKYNKDWGYINKNGYLQFRCHYEKSGDFSEGLACVNDEKGRMGYIDKTGYVVIPFDLK